MEIQIPPLGNVIAMIMIVLFPGCSTAEVLETIISKGLKNVPSATLAAPSAAELSTETPFASATPLPTQTWIPGPSPTPTQRAEREVGVVCSFEVPCAGVTDQMLEPLQEEQIHRLTDADGSPLPFGYLESYDYQDDDGYTRLFFSGIVRGFVQSPDYRSLGWVVMEMPQEDGISQYWLWHVGAEVDGPAWQLWYTPNGNFNDRVSVPLDFNFSWFDLKDMFDDQRMIGQQVVIGENIDHPEFDHEFYKDHDEIIRAIMDGRPVSSASFRHIVQDRVVDQSTFEQLTGLNLP